MRRSQENYQRPRNPLNGFGKITVKHEGGHMKITQGIGK